jgi:alpha-ketoglutarate-dependent taurine dioxygenase
MPSIDMVSAGLVRSERSGRGQSLRPLTPSFGLVIEASAGDDLTDISLARLSELLKSRRGGAVLFRNFNVSEEKFREFTEARGENFVVHHNLSRRDYVDGDRTFATVNKGNAAIGFHNELSSSPLSPDVFWMHCGAPAQALGKTGISDGIGVALSLTGPTRRFFARRKFVITRTFAKDEWTARFNGDRARVESWLESVGRRRGVVEFAFAPESEALTYTYALAALRQARLSSHEVWCCGLLDSPEHYKLEGGTPPPRHVVVEATHAIYQNACWIDWRPGDVLVVDNTRFMHSREAFEGEGRRILVRYSDLKTPEPA